jgi:hypothetical protein
VLADVDELFDAVEDAIGLDRQTLPVAAALDRLTAVLEQTSGDGPADELIAAAVTVCMTATPTWPTRPPPCRLPPQPAGTECS